MTKPDNGIPGHIAIIMDGNGRWAKARGRERLYGHSEGMESVRAVIEASVRHGVKYLTLYAFSKENWGRPQDEVDGLMEIFCEYAVRETPELKAKGVKLHFIGDTAAMSPAVQKSIQHCINETIANEGLNVVIAVNYGSRWEIAQAARAIAEKTLKGEIAPEEIDIRTLSDNLTTKNIPDPDLLIRTSGECRLSNFLLWQLAYTELYFTDVLWPDFREEHLLGAIELYKVRDRRFGLI